MMKWLRLLSTGVILSLLLGTTPRFTFAQDSANAAVRILAYTNAARIANGLPPYALNSLLTLSAQRHSEYQASIGQWTHTGPDGSRTLQRALAVGYPAIRANENIYAGHVTPEEAAYWWLTADAEHRNNMLHPTLREIGVGAAQDTNGTIYYTMDISAQPNVLPMFVNGDAYSTAAANVTLTLTNEDVFPGGLGQIGHVSQVMISNSPDFSGAATQGWAQYINWTLDSSSGGAKTVYVRYIDSAGRTADAQDAIILGDAGVGQPPAQQPTIPVVVPPTSAPVAPPVQQPGPRYTAIPQPTIALPPPLPTITPTGAVAVAERPQIGPTLDFSNSEYMKARQGLITRSALTSTESSLSPTLSADTLRPILLVVLMLGIGALAVGGLSVIRSRRLAAAASTAEANETSDTDELESN